MICLLIEKLRAGFEMPRDRTKKHLINAYNDLYFAFSLHFTPSKLDKKIIDKKSYTSQLATSSTILTLSVFSNNNSI